MKKKVKLLTSVITAFAAFIMCMTMVSCTTSGETDDSSVTKLSFKAASSYEYLKGLSGTEVTINGYLATSSPVDGSFIFLMNLPYQNCPFCKPNTSQLSNTIEVYPKEGSSFDYTSQAVKVTGTLEVAEEGQSYTDLYGYEFNFKIINADYVILKDSDLTEETALWQKIADSGVISDIYKMFDYLNFICNWGTYTATFTGGKDYLYPADLEYFCFNDGTQYHYGYAEGYFDGIIKDIRKLSSTLEDLVKIIEKCKDLNDLALSEYNQGHYSKVAEYTTGSDGNLLFGDGRGQYKMDNSLIAETNDDLYYEFYAWFSAWEM